MLIALYLIAIIIANLTVAYYGPSVAIVNAFLFIGLDLTTRDYLHEQWQGKGLSPGGTGKALWLKMLALIGAGSLLSYALNVNAGPIALASFVAFAGAGIADTLVYWLLGDKAKLVKVNGSNVVSAAIDSLIFPILAFGLPILWWIVLGQFAAKVAGGFVWSLALIRVKVMKLAIAETNEMTKDELVYAIGDILLRETDRWGRCRWCRAEERPVNLAGEEADPEDADEYRIQHEADCAVTYIEAVLAGNYEYVNEPPKAQD